MNCIARFKSNPNGYKITAHNLEFCPFCLITFYNPNA